MISHDALSFIINDWSKGSIIAEDLVVLEEHCKGKSVVELGTNIGTTTKFLATIAKYVCTIDVFENVNEIRTKEQRENYVNHFIANPHYYLQIKKYLEQETKSGSVHIIQADTVNASTLFADSAIDICFIDADHSYAGVTSDYNAWYSKVKKGGKFLFHDCNDLHPGVLKFTEQLSSDNRVNELTSNYNSSIRIFQKMDG